MSRDESSFIDLRLWHCLQCGMFAERTPRWSGGHPTHVHCKGKPFIVPDTYPVIAVWMLGGLRAVADWHGMEYDPNMSIARCWGHTTGPVIDPPW